MKKILDPNPRAFLKRHPELYSDLSTKSTSDNQQTFDVKSHSAFSTSLDGDNPARAFPALPLLLPGTRTNHCSVKTAPESSYSTLATEQGTTTDSMSDTKGSTTVIQNLAGAHENLAAPLSDGSAQDRDLPTQNITSVPANSTAVCTIRTEVEHACLMEKVRLNWQAAQSVAIAEMSSNEEGGIRSCSVAAKR